MFDVLMYLFETYIYNNEAEIRVDQDKLTDDLAEWNRCSDNNDRSAFYADIQRGRESAFRY